MKKVCNNKDCKHKGVPQPMDNFYKSDRYSSGRVGICMDCSAEKRIKYEETRKKNKKDFYDCFITYTR